MDISLIPVSCVHQTGASSTNLVERSFEEERRRAKVLPRFRTEKECLKLVFAVLWRARATSEMWCKFSSWSVSRFYAA